MPEKTVRGGFPVVFLFEPREYECIMLFIVDTPLDTKSLRAEIMTSFNPHNP